MEDKKNEVDHKFKPGRSYVLKKGLLSAERRPR